MDLQNPAVLPMHNSGELFVSLVESHIPFARRLAAMFYRKHRCSGIEFEEFLGQAFVGLCAAAQRFDESRGVTFVTFAYLAVQGAMLKLIQAHRGFQRYSKRDSYEAARREYFAMTSRFDETPQGDQARLLEDTETREQIRTLIQKLPDIERKIIQQRYYAEKSNGEIARDIGYSHSQTSRLHRQALTELKFLISRAEREEAT